MSKNTRRNLRPFGIRLIWCEIVSASFLFGAFFNSISISLVTLGLFGLGFHFLLTQYSSNKMISAMITFLWFMGTFFWGSWLDEIAATSYITIILTLLVTCISYWANTQVLQWPEIDQWFHTPSSKD